MGNSETDRFAKGREMKTWREEGERKGKEM